MEIGMRKRVQIENLVLELGCHQVDGISDWRESSIINAVVQIISPPGEKSGEKTHCGRASAVSSSAC